MATDDASFPVSPATRLDRGDEVAFLNSLVVEWAEKKVSLEELVKWGVAMADDLE